MRLELVISRQPRRCGECGLVETPGYPQQCPLGSSEACRSDCLPGTNGLTLPLAVLATFVLAIGAFAGLGFI